MEHTGVPNRIHFSEATTDLQLEGGKGSWLIPRERARFKRKEKKSSIPPILRTKEATSMSHTSFTDSSERLEH